MSTVMQALDNSESESRVAVDVARVAPDLVAQLEAERIPRGDAFRWRKDAPVVADTPAAIGRRLAELEAALAALEPGWDPRTAAARLRVVPAA